MVLFEASIIAASRLLLFKSTSPFAAIDKIKVALLNHSKRGLFAISNGAAFNAETNFVTGTEPESSEASSKLM